MPDVEFRTLSIARTDAATLVEGLTLLSYFEAKQERKATLPYNAQSIADLTDRVLTRWPELRSIYQGNRAERRAGR